MKFLCLLFCIMMSSHGVFAYETDQILEGDTLETIAMRNISRVLPRYSTIPEYKKSIKEWNPRIKNWDNLPTYHYIFVDYPYDIPKYMLNNKVFTFNPNILFSDDIGDKKVSYFIAITTSNGNYKESIDDQSIKSSQNFPVTLGLSSSYKFDENKNLILGSIYWAWAANANINGLDSSKDNSLKIPGEMGLNLYYQHFFKDFIGLYGGLDYEKLNTFNTREVIDGLGLKNTQNNIFYGTLGISKNIQYKNFPMSFKGSFSKIVKSSSSDSINMTGSKFILFYSIRPKGKINYNIFFKHHNLTGSTKLSINRFGVGISFQL